MVLLNLVILLRRLLVEVVHVKIKQHFFYYSSRSGSDQSKFPSIWPMRYLSYLIISIGCHIGYHLIRSIFNTSHLYATLVLFNCMFEILYWVPVLIFEWMDRGGVSETFRKKYKLPHIESNVTFAAAVIGSLLNQAWQQIFLSVLIYCLLSQFNDSFWATLAWILVYYVIHDIIFYFGHVLMHKWKWLYMNAHKQHHTVYASLAASAHYMTWIDFFFESTLESIGQLLSFPLGGSPIAFISFTCVGVFNGVVVHSGYDLPLLPDPKRHYLHHAKFIVNYSIGPMDTVFGTVDNGETLSKELLKNE
jgi:hypothetical protein